MFLNHQTDPSSIPYRSNLIVNGYLYDYSSALTTLAPSIIITNDFYGQTLNALFRVDHYQCQPFYTTNPGCLVDNPVQGSASVGSNDSSRCTLISLAVLNKLDRLIFTWKDVSDLGLVVLNNAVLNMTLYYSTMDAQNLLVDRQEVFQRINSSIGSDATRLFLNTYQDMAIMNCLVQSYTIGYIDSQSNGCAAGRPLTFLDIFDSNNKQIPSLYL